MPRRSHCCARRSPGRPSDVHSDTVRRETMGEIVAYRKKCGHCGKSKVACADRSVSEFCRARDRPDGFHHRCKVCNRIMLSEYRQTEKSQSATATYRARDDVKARRREYDYKRYAARLEWQRA